MWRRSYTAGARPFRAITALAPHLVAFMPLRGATADSLIPHDLSRESMQSITFFTDLCSAICQKKLPTEESHNRFP
jgi:hypothetical protein